MKIRPHGTRAKYVFEKCRCIPCADANRDYMLTLDRECPRPPWRARAISGGPTKGAAPAYYRVEQCFSHEVEATHLTHDEAYELRDHLNATAWMDGLESLGPRLAPGQTAAAARRHVRALAEHGVGYRQIARLAGCNRKLVQALMNGDGRPGRARRRFRRATLEAILAVKVTDAAPGAYVPAAETWRLIDEMLAAGATKTRIAKALGSKARVPTLQLGRDRVTKAHGDAIQRLHDLFWRGSARMRAVCRCVATGRDEEAA